MTLRHITYAPRETAKESFKSLFQIGKNLLLSTTQLLQPVKTTKTTTGTKLIVWLGAFFSIESADTVSCAPLEWTSKALKCQKRGEETHSGS